MDNIDVEKLQTSFLQADADNRSLYRVISILEQENKHLRQVIEILITSKSPTI